ncbi:MAG: hypothetical protein K2H89_11345 [Oscillospiraceae bacterium]|nr:hypothetical protein [Oscillospiraceae bacterium]
MIVLILLLAFCLSGCNSAWDQNADSGDLPMETFVTYKALPLPDLFVDIPENYAIKSSQFYQEYYVCEDASIIITEDTRDSQYVSNYDYAVSALKEYQNMASSLELISSEAMTTQNATNVQTLEFDYTIGDGDESAKLTCFVGYLTDGHAMYIITCKSNTDTYESHRSEFLSVICSAAISK